MKWWFVAFIVNLEGEFGHIQYLHEFATRYSCVSYYKQNTPELMQGLQSKLVQDNDKWVIQNVACLPSNIVNELDKKTRNKHDSI